MGKKTLAMILALSATVGVSACRDLDNSPNAHKEQRFHISPGHINALPYNVNDCKVDSKEFVKYLDDVISLDENWDLVKLSVRERDMVNELRREKYFDGIQNYSDLMHLMVQVAPYVASEVNIRDEILCRAKSVALQLDNKASFERDIIEQYVSEADKDMRYPYVFLDRLGFFVDLQEKTMMTVPHLTLNKPMLNMFGIMVEEVSVGDMSTAINLAPQYLDFTQRVFPEPESMRHRSYITELAFNRVNVSAGQEDDRTVFEYYANAIAIGNRLEVDYDQFEEEALLAMQNTGMNVNRMEIDLE